MKSILALLALTICSVSFANITGEWSGWGDWTYEGSGTHCSPMTLSFEESAGLLVRHGGYFDCQIVALDVAPGQWVKQGNNLLVDNNIVGSITDKGLHMEENYSEDVVIMTDISYEGNHMDYTETWFNKEKIVIYEITGRFFRRDVANN